MEYDPIGFNPESNWDQLEKWIQENSVPDHSFCDKDPCSLCVAHGKRKGKRREESFQTSIRGPASTPAPPQAVFGRPRSSSRRGRCQP